MTSFLVVAALGATAVSVVRGDSGAVSEPTPVVLPRTEQFEVTSKANLTYRIFVSLPSSKAPEAGSPVVYLTDGNTGFPIVLSAARRLTQGDPAASIVVGIGYPDDESKVQYDRRTYDLVGPATDEYLRTFQAGAPIGKKAGGNDQFLAFIEDELKPLLEKKYKIDKTRQTLFGHSFGGLFTLHVAFAKPQSFQNYVASSPSIWWNNEAILEEEKAFVERHRKNPTRVRIMISCGEWEGTPAPGTNPMRVAMLKSRKMAANARAMADRLTAESLESLTVLFREFAEEDHGSVLLPAASRGMRFALEN